MFGAALSLFALAAALSFGSSLNRLVSTPGLSGWNWDALMFPNTRVHAEAVGKQLETVFDRSPQVSGWAIGDINNVRIQGNGMLSIAMDTRKGGVAPSIVDGHVPEGPDQILLGTHTLEKLGVAIGDTVLVKAHGNALRMRIVGRVAIPPLFFSFAKPGQGAAMSLEASDRLNAGNGPPRAPDAGAFFVRFAPGVDQQAFLDGLRRRTNGGITVIGQQPSGQLSSLRGISDVPLVLAGIVALMAAATLAHTLITSIRRRRLDFAILKTLGFVRRQVSATVAWQATTLAVVAVAVGLPLGLLSGRWGWHVFSDRLGVVPQVVVPVASVLIAVPVTIVVGNLLAVIPGRIASRLRAANVMRTE
jgi:ABC-type lipoprotein release transport system permease subunit